VLVPVDDEADDWSWVCVWSLEDEAVWLLELELDEDDSAAVPAGSERLGTDAGATSWLALSLPQALTPRTASARRASTYVRISLRVARN
jgi:hypothetical protein